MDDSFLLCPEDRTEVGRIKDILKEIKEAPGLVVRFEKSIIFSSKNIEAGKAIELADIMGVKLVHNRVRILGGGLLSIVGKKKKDISKEIKRSLEGSSRMTVQDPIESG